MTAVEVTDAAGRAGDPAAVALLARAMDGPIRLALTRNPSPTRSSELLGRPPRLILATERGEPVGMAMVWRRPVFLEGAETEIGYLGQLRLVRPAGRESLRRGFDLALRDADGIATTLTSIASENHRARRLLERGPGIPRYREIGELATLVFPTRRTRSAHGRRAGPADREAILGLLDEQRSSFVLAPRWRPEDLPPDGRCRDLELGDFVVMETGGVVRGACAIWDQRGFKQVVVTGYRRILSRLRPLLNLVARGSGWPPLPAPGSVLRLAFLSHFAATTPAIACDLVRTARSAARERGLDWISLSLSARDPLLCALSRLRHRRYATVLYSVGEHGAELGPRIAAGFRPEGALL